MNIVDVQFPLKGTVIPVDHGYALYSAISRLIPDFHGNDNIGIHHIGGTLSGNRSQIITEKSFLTLRLPEDLISRVIPLSGKILRLGDGEIRLGLPRSKPLIPGASLYSRLVIIKGFIEPEAFLLAAKKQLNVIGVNGEAHLVYQPQIAEQNEGSRTGTHSPFLRRTIRIRDNEVVGFALRVALLNAEESISLQETGVGGRRRFGCGIFVPYAKAKF